MTVYCVLELLAASCNAMETAEVVLPTPPLPARKVRRARVSALDGLASLLWRRDAAGPAGGAPAFHCVMAFAVSRGAQEREAAITGASFVRASASLCSRMRSRS